MSSGGDFVRRVARQTIRQQLSKFVGLSSGSVQNPFIGKVSQDKRTIQHPNGTIFNLTFGGNIKKYELAYITGKHTAYAPGRKKLKTVFIDGSQTVGYILVNDKTTPTMYVIKVGDSRVYRWVDNPNGSPANTFSGITGGTIFEFTPNGKHLVYVFMSGSSPHTYTAVVWKNFRLGLDETDTPVVSSSNIFSFNGSTSWSGNVANFDIYPYTRTVDGTERVFIDILGTGGLSGTAFAHHIQGICPETSDSGSATSTSFQTLFGTGSAPASGTWTTFRLFRSLNNVTASALLTNNTFVFSPASLANFQWKSTPVLNPATAIASNASNPIVVTDIQTFTASQINPQSISALNHFSADYLRIKPIDSNLFYSQTVVGVNANDPSLWDVRIDLLTYNSSSGLFETRKSITGVSQQLTETDHTATFNSSAQYRPYSIVIKNGIRNNT